MNEHVFNNTCTAIRCKCIYILYIYTLKKYISYTQGTARGYPGLSSQVGGCTKKALRCENSSSRKCYAALCGKPFNSKSPLIATYRNHLFTKMLGHDPRASSIGLLGNVGFVSWFSTIGNCLEVAQWHSNFCLPKNTNLEEFVYVCLGHFKLLGQAICGRVWC